MFDVYCEVVSLQDLTHLEPGDVGAQVTLIASPACPWGSTGLLLMARAANLCAGRYNLLTRGDSCMDFKPFLLTRGVSCKDLKQQLLTIGGSGMRLRLLTRGDSA